MAFSLGVSRGEETAGWCSDKWQRMESRDEDLGSATSRLCDLRQAKTSLILSTLCNTGQVLNPLGSAPGCD